jgi:hypothetical protein
MTDSKFIPSVLVDNTSLDPLNPNGTVLNTSRLNNIQSQYKYTAGIQKLDVLPSTPDAGITLAIWNIDGNVYMWDGSNWNRIGTGPTWAAGTRMYGTVSSSEIIDNGVNPIIIRPGEGLALLQKNGSELGRYEATLFFQTESLMTASSLSFTT